MAFIYHMRRSAFFPGRTGGLITEITWKAGRLEVICLHGFAFVRIVVSCNLWVISHRDSGNRGRGMQDRDGFLPVSEYFIFDGIFLFLGNS